MIEHLTVVTTCSIHYNQKRPTYSKMWVDKLHSAVKRNLDISFEFICFTNDIQSDDYRIEPLTTDSWGWWNKLEQFKHGLLKGPVLSLDLDLVICKNITEVIATLPTDRMLMVQEPYQDIINSSMTYWNGDYGFLFDEYVANKDEIVAAYADPTKKMSDQGFISDRVEVDLIENHAPDNFFGWKHHITGAHNLEDPSVLIFTSTEKPTNNQHLEIVSKNWI